MRVTNELLIVADDLTGAADCAIACVSDGLSAVVVLNAAAAGEHADVVAIDADTRRMPAAQAAAETARIVQTLGQNGRLLFQKIDSTLRGNIGAEVAAALSARRCMDRSAVVVMAPAFPATGRTTVGGRQHVKGMPLPERADIGELLEQAGLRTARIDLDCVRRGSTICGAGYDALVFDAETDQDLSAIAARAVSLGRATVWVGSAGLARQLPRAAGLQRAPKPVNVAPAKGPLVFVVGSPSPVSREQADALAREPGVEVIRDPKAPLLAEALARGRDVLLLLDNSSQAGGVAPFLDAIGGFVFTGGETAREALESIGVGALRLAREIEPGVALSVTLGAREMPVITKAGAFGECETLVRCRAAMRNL